MGVANLPLQRRPPLQAHATEHDGVVGDFAVPAAAQDGVEFGLGEDLPEHRRRRPEQHPLTQVGAFGKERIEGGGVCGGKLPLPVGVQKDQSELGDAVVLVDGVTGQLAHDLRAKLVDSGDAGEQQASGLPGVEGDNRQASADIDGLQVGIDCGKSEIRRVGVAE